MSTNRQIRTFQVRELRSGTNGAKKIITGYAAVYDQWSDLLGYFREIIRPGAFKNVLGDDVRCLFNHDPSQILGRTAAGTLRLAEDRRGLSIECEMPDTNVGRDVHAMIDRRDIDQMSFSFDVGEDRWTFSSDPGKPDEREILLLERLYDVAPVTFPAYSTTSVAARSGDEVKLEYEAAKARNRSASRARARWAELALLEIADEPT